MHVPILPGVSSPASLGGRVVGGAVAVWIGGLVPLVCVPGLTSRHNHGAHLIFDTPGVPTHAHADAGVGTPHGHPDIGGAHTPDPYRHGTDPGWHIASDAAQGMDLPPSGGRVFDFTAAVPPTGSPAPAATPVQRLGDFRSLRTAFEPSPPWHPPRTA